MNELISGTTGEAALGSSSGLAGISGLRSRLLDEIPSGIVVIDPSLQIVDHNRTFGDLFGSSCGRSCHEVTRQRSTPCPSCPATATFADGRSRTLEQSGRDRDGRRIHYLVQITPMAGSDGGIEYVAAITTDLTATRRLQQEYQTLFEKVPCFVAVINRDHRVVKANEAFRRVFGPPAGEPCWELYRRGQSPCGGCPVDRTFADGKTHHKQQIGVSRCGRSTPFLVYTAPLLEDEGGVSHVIEMALDMTEHRDLEQRLGRANVLPEALIEASLDAILVLDERLHVVLANPTAELLTGFSAAELEGRPIDSRLVPKPLEEILKGTAERKLLHESVITTAADEEIPVRAAGVALLIDGHFAGSALIMQDLRPIKKLEREKLDAERLAAVGQTVAGLAHGIKNIITGLEGGMYVSASGMKRGDEGRIRQGWEMLERNVARISELSRSLLAFSRGERLQCRSASLAGVVHEVVALYQQSASHHGIDLRAEIEHEPEPAYVDPEGLHSCLANLVSNSIDACLMSSASGCEIIVRLYEKDRTLYLEVSDSGCGMDYEVKQKAFTSFFSTKGKGGTGLGLLLTRKIVQQHGGAIDLGSEPGEGTTFTITLPRDRLPEPDREERA